MVYDCFQFFNELDILQLRLHVLNDVVDKFVISESTVTFSGQPKPLFYEENKEQFREFEDKIIHVVVDDTPMDGDAFQRDHHQKCAVARGLVGCKPDDIVIFSDVDEIPNPEVVKDLIPKVEDGKIYMLAQRLFYGYLNLEDISGNNLSVTGEFDGVARKKWLGTKICRYSLLSTYTTEQLRDAAQKKIGVRVDNGGWHFSYMGGTKSMTTEERIRYKIQSAAHQEYNSRRVLAEVGPRLRSKQDFLGRNAKMVVVPIDDTFPKYLRDHLKDYDYLLYKEPKWYEKLRDALFEWALKVRAKLKGQTTK